MPFALSPISFFPVVGIVWESETLTSTLIAGIVESATETELAAGSAFISKILTSICESIETVTFADGRYHHKAKPPPKNINKNAKI